jgi:hypothetical protein
MSPARLGATYMFSGRLKRGANGLEPEKDALSPVRDLVIFVDDPGKAGSVLCWKTDSKGLLYPLTGTGNSRPTAVHYLGKKRRVFIPPRDVMLNAWAKKREKWAEALAGGIAAKSTYQASELNEIDVPRASLRPPDRESNDPAEKEWAKFYDSLPETASLAAWVFPTTRALLVHFASAAMAGSTVEVTPEGKESIKCTAEGDEKGAFAVAIGDENSLPAGMYSFTVTFPGEVSSEWSKAVARDRRYQLKEQVRFGISNFAGDFEIVNCDPISIEDSVIQQFPSLYWHRIAAAKKRDDYPEVETDPSYTEVPKALEQWAERLEWAQAKAKLTVGLINASGWNKRGRMIGKLVWKNVKSTDNELLKATKDSIDLAFQVRGQYKEWKEVIENLKAEKELAGLKKVLWQDLEGHFDRYRWWSYVKEQFLEGDKEWKVLSLASATEAERKVILKAGIPEKRTALEELIGKSAGGKIQKGLVVAQLAIDVYQAALAFNEVLESRKEKDELVGDLDELFKQVDSKIARAACREAIGNLERMRAATIAAERKVDDEEAKALMAAVDAALGAMVLVFPPMAIVVTVKETLSLAKDVAIEFGEWVDRVAHFGVATWFKRNWGQMAELAGVSGANQSLMPKIGADGGADDLNVQLRLRAEALHGLVGLLTRASVASKTEKEYLERVDKYRVDQYIQNYLLNDGWQLPVRPALPIGMDAAWMYLTSPYGSMLTQSAAAEQLGFAHPLRAAAINALPGAMTMLSVVDSVLAGNAVAKFHKTFPLHRRDTAVQELAKAFRTTMPELDTDAFEYTCIYSRPAGSEGKGGWKPVNDQGVHSVEQLRLLSPLDQIRILVVLKSKNAGGCYPLSFQLVRTDGVDIEGPVYRDLTRRLRKDEDLLPEEAQFDGRLGCVFRPFFALGKQMVPGIKPLASHASWLGAGGYKFFGFLDDMTYAFQLKVGDRSDFDWMKIGAANAAPSKLDEFRVGFTGKPNEDSLLVADFLDSHSKEFVYPPLFQFAYGKGFGPCYARVGKGGFQLATAAEDGNLSFDKFTWHEAVEFIVVAYCSSITQVDWEKMKLDWSRVPVQMQLVNIHTMGSDDGPTYTSTLNYLGKLFMENHAIAPGEAKLDAPVEEWAAQVRSSPAELQKLADAVDPQNFASEAGKKDYYHLFAAHFPLDYFVPEGEHVKSLRPFGRILTGPSEQYRICVRNLKTPEKCNLEQPTMVTPVRTVLRPEYEFCFPAPASHKSGVPWKNVDDLEKWIKTQAKKRNPNVELFKK